MTAIGGSLSTTTSLLTSRKDISLPIINLVWASAQHDSWLCCQNFEEFDIVSSEGKT